MKLWRLILRRLMGNSRAVRIACTGADTIALDDLTEFQGGLKALAAEDAAKLRQVILTYGFSAPILAWRNGKASYILDGHQRLKVLAGLRDDGYRVPPLPVDWIKARSIKEAKQKLLTITSSYGKASRAGLESYLLDAGLQLPETLEIIRLPEVRLPPMARSTDADDEFSAEVATVTEPGDAWTLDSHMIICDDCTKRWFDEDPDLVLTDPPYGVDIVSGGSVGGASSQMGFVGGDGAVGVHRYPVMQGDQVRIDPTFLLGHGQHQAIFGANYFADLLPPTPSWLVWDKEDCGGNRNNFADVELVWTSWGRAARIYHHLWKGMARKGNRIDESVRRLHATQKPVGLLAAILMEAPIDIDIVADPFLGSGSVLIAAAKIGARCLGMEIEPWYCDVAVERYRQWSHANDREPVIKRNGQTL